MLMHEFLAQWAFAAPASAALTDDAAIAAAMAAEEDHAPFGSAARAAGFPATASVHKFRQTRPPVWSRGALHAMAPAPPAGVSVSTITEFEAAEAPGGSGAIELPVPTVTLQVVSALRCILFTTCCFEFSRSSTK